MTKYFILDTNVLIHDPEAIPGFDDNHVIIPIVVIEELDNLKTMNNDAAHNARHITRYIDSLRSKGDLNKGVVVNENGGILRIVLVPENIKLPEGFDVHKKDNLILGIAYKLHKEGKKVIFVSKDLNARIKASTLGLKTQDYEKHKVKLEKLYTGWYEINIKQEFVDKFYKEKKINLENVNGKNPNHFKHNNFLLLKSIENENKTALARVVIETNEAVPLNYNGESIWGITALNMEQRFAFELLLDPDINLVTLVGPAGTGKTLLAIAAGMKMTMDDNIYKKILVTRPIMPLGKDIGYLPGSKDEKMSVWMQPIFDNIHFILDRSDDFETVSMKQTESQVNYFIENGLLELGAVTYIRGRSIPKQFIVIDEAQNLTPHEIKTIVSRVGEKSKIVLTGDPQQIDNPYLDADSNGLTYLAEKFCDQKLAGHITLKKSERSGLASLAATIL